MESPASPATTFEPQPTRLGRCIGNMLYAMVLPVPQDSPLIAVVASLLMTLLLVAAFGLFYWMGWLLPFGDNATPGRAFAMFEYIALFFTCFGITAAWVRLQEIL